jgi:hypothetical protein
LRCSDTGGVPSASYNATNETSRTPLTMAEAEGLLADGARALGRDEKALTHLLERLPVTLRTHRDAVTGLTRQLESARRTQQFGRPSTLSPRDAVRFLAPEDLDLVLADRIQAHTAPLQAIIEALQSELAAVKAGRR